MKHPIYAHFLNQTKCGIQLPAMSSLLIINGAQVFSMRSPRLVLAYGVGHFTSVTRRFLTDLLLLASQKHAPA